MVFEPLELCLFLDLDRLSFDLLRPLPLAELLPLDSICDTGEVDDPRESRCRMSSLRTRSRTSSNFNLLLPDELLTAVTVAFQLSGREDKRIKARTSLSKSIPTELNWVVTVLSSFRCCAVDAPSPIRKLNNRLIK